MVLMPKRPASASSKRRTKKTSHKFRQYFLLLGIFLLSMLFLSAYSFIRHFEKARIFADSSDSSGIFSSAAYSVAFIVLEDDFLTIPPKIKEIKILYIKQNSPNSFFVNIPVNYGFDMPGKYGEESFSSVLALGMLDNIGGEQTCSATCFQNSMLYVESALKLLTGYSLDKWVVVEPEIQDYVENLVLQGDTLRFLDKKNIKLLSKSMRTNFTVSEFFTHYHNLRALKTRDLRIISFSLQEVLDSNLRELNYNSNISSQELSLAILNATKSSGVASFGGRVVKNVGGHVISVENAQNIEETTYMITDNPESYVAQYLSNFFAISKNYSKKHSPINDPAISRADVTLVIGLDFLENY